MANRTWQRRHVTRSMFRTASRHRAVAALCIVAVALSACSVIKAGAGSGSGSAGGKKGGAIQILVPTTVGGGTDTIARFVAPRIRSELPGNPAIQVVDTGDSSFIPGMNQFAKSQNDGRHWLMTSGSGHLPYIFNDKSLTLDLKNAQPVMGFTVGNVVMVRSATGIKTPADLVKAPKVVYGGGGPLEEDITQLLGLYLLGVKYKSVFGLKTGPRQIALQQKTVDVIYDTTPAYLANGKDLVDRGVARILYTAGQLENGKIVRDPAFPDVPTLAEVYTKLHGKAPSGPAWDAYKALIAATTTFSKALWLHSNDPTDSVTGARTAAKKMVATKDFYKKAEPVLGPYKMVIADKQNAADIKQAFSIDQQTRDWLTRWLKTQFDVVPGK